MKLLCFSSHNIWPFIDRTISVCFRDGRYLIKAPIGSWKSFLFFDGPVFGIYKYSERQMLSIKATEWWIKVCFEHDGKILVVIRDITRTKSGNDTVKSSLFVIENSIDEVEKFLDEYDIVEQEKDIVGDIMTKTKLQKIECKNETDVQTTIASFIPLQEVFLSTAMLLQWSDNVFELAPADRISLFKEIFGLMSIDSATDKINDERKTVSALVKSKKITDDVDTRLQNNLQAIIQAWSTLPSTYTDLYALLDELKLIADKISITWFTLDEKRDSVINTIHSSLTNEYNTIQQSLGALQSHQDHYLMLQKELQNTLQEWQTITKKIATIQESLQNNITEDITSQKNTREKKCDQWVTTLSGSRFTWSRQTFPTIWEQFQQLMQQWKLLAEQEKFLNATIQQLESKQLDDTTTLDSYSSQLASLQKDYDAKKKFECIKIDAECPFVEQINTWLFAWLKRNIEATEQTRNAYIEKIAQTNIASQIVQKQQELATIQEQLSTIKTNPLYLQHKDITQAKKEYDILVDEQYQLLRKEKELAHQITAHKEAQKTLLQFQEQAKFVEKTRLSLEEKIQTAQKNTSDEQISTLRQKWENITLSINTLSKIQQHLTRIQDLISQHKDNQRTIKSLEEKETLLNDLYRIFSKEIMIKVLEDALPFFAEYVNNLLAKMVSFTIHFQPKKTTSDKLELDITIRDHHGERLVKSLSGWQKAILRLAWILWVAQMTRAKQLFLDETINNIDQDTISHVADMLKDYTKMHDITIYLVTHSSQLQMMNIWDNTIHLTQTNEI